MREREPKNGKSSNKMNEMKCERNENRKKQMENLRNEKIRRERFSPTSIARNVKKTKSNIIKRNNQ